MNNTDEKISFLILSRKKDAIKDFIGYTNLIDVYQAARLQYRSFGGKGRLIGWIGVVGEIV